jgi:hypothetical protein
MDQGLHLIQRQLFIVVEALILSFTVSGFGFPGRRRNVGRERMPLCTS